MGMSGGTVKGLTVARDFEAAKWPERPMVRQAGHHNEEEGLDVELGGARSARTSRRTSTKERNVRVDFGQPNGVTGTTAASARGAVRFTKCGRS